MPPIAPWLLQVIVLYRRALPPEAGEAESSKLPLGSLKLPDIFASALVNDGAVPDWLARRNVHLKSFEQVPMVGGRARLRMQPA